MQFSVSPPPSGHCVRQPRWGRQSISAASHPASAVQSSASSSRLSSPVGLGNSGSGTRNHQFASVRELPTNNLSKILTYFHFRMIKVYKSRVTCPILSGRVQMLLKKTCYVLCIRTETKPCHMSPSHLPDNTLEIPRLPELTSSTVKIEKSHRSRNKEAHW